MKRLLVLLAAAAALSVAASACLAPVPIAPPHYPAPSMLVVGDSLSAGTWGRTEPGKHWWQYVAEHLGARTTLHATPGWTSRDALWAGRPGPVADLVVVQLGSNDQVVFEDPLVYRDRLRAMARWGQICIIVAPWERTGFAAATAPAGMLPLIQYRLNALRAALDEGCGFVDWGNLSTATPGYTWDGLHPTPQGNAVLASQVTAVMAE